MTGPRLAIEALTAQAFAPFGDVIEAREDAHHYPVNGGQAERFHDLARPDVSASGGHAMLSIFRARPRPSPVCIELVERHLLGTQAFVPMSGQRFLVVVAAAGPAPDVTQLRCFIAARGQGVNYARGTWHSPLLAIDEGGDFLVVDRGSSGTEVDCDEHRMPGGGVWVEV